MEHSELLAQDLDDLYFDLGTQLGYESFGGDDYRMIVGQAKEWMAERRETLRARVCPRAASTSDRAVDLSAVADALSGYAHGPMGLVVAAIILKTGLRHFCDGFGDPD